MCAHVCVFMCVPAHMCGDQRTKFGSWFSPCAIWFLGIELKSSNSLASTFTTEPSYQPQTFSFHNSFCEELKTDVLRIVRICDWVLDIWDHHYWLWEMCFGLVLLFFFLQSPLKVIELFTIHHFLTCKSIYWTSFFVSYCLMKVEIEMNYHIVWEPACLWFRLRKIFLDRFLTLTSHEVWRNFKRKSFWWRQ